MPKIKENLSLEEAQRIVKKEGGIRAEEIVYGGKTHISFYGRNDLFMADYCKEDKKLIILTEKERSEIKEREERKDLEFQQKEEKTQRIGRVFEQKYKDYLTHRGILRQRFPGMDITKKIKIVSIEELGGAAGGYGRISKKGGEIKAKIFIYDKLKKGTPFYASVLTHELVHYLRDKENREKENQLIDETETELECSIRGGIIDIRGGGGKGYYGEDYNMAKHDYKFLIGGIPPLVYPELHVPLTKKIVKEIGKKGKETGLYKTLSEGPFNNEDIDTQYRTSEGDMFRAYAPKGRINKKKIAKFIDRLDGIIGEEDVWEITNGKRKMLLTDKGRPDKVVKKVKKYFPQINIPFLVNKKVSKRKKKSKKDPIADVLGFRFFR